MSHIAESKPTQITHPWRAALRTGGVALVSIVLASPLWGPEVVEFVEGQFPGSPAVAIVASAIGFTVGLSILINRLVLIPAISDLLTKLNLGPSPKA